MKNNERVIIQLFNVIGEDERGVTAIFALQRQQDNFIYITRKAGSLSGNTYHEGQSAATNPKLLILLQGRILFSYRHIDETQVHEIEVQAPALIQVTPYVTHKVEAIEDIIILEGNAIADIQNDRHRLEV